MGDTSKYECKHGIVVSDEWMIGWLPFENTCDHIRRIVPMSIVDRIVCVHQLVQPTMGEPNTACTLYTMQDTGSRFWMVLSDITADSDRLIAFYEVMVIGS
jgi:hypothetical protein